MKLVQAGLFYYHIGPCYSVRKGSGEFGVIGRKKPSKLYRFYSSGDNGISLREAKELVAFLEEADLKRQKKK